MFTDLARVTRRHALLAAGLLASQALLGARISLARGRTPLGGRLSIRVPWPVASMDPHRLDDAAALFFGRCLFDALYSVDASGAVSPALAESLADPCAEGVRVTLREGVRFASGKRLTARDVACSIARARASGSRGWLDAVGTVHVTGSGTLTFGGHAVDRVARALASPLAAVVPEGFAPGRPDGTGPFAARCPGDALVLVRNDLAAQGPSFLERLSIAPAPDLAASLRAFESGEDDLGWLGLGLHEPRRGAVPFDAGALGWAILRTGDQAGRWNAPGVAQRLADGIDPSRLAHLGVRADWTAQPDDGWGGPPAALLVRADSPWLVELGRAVAVALSRPGHEVTVSPVSPIDLARARSSGAYALALDLARPFDETPLGAYVALVTAEDPVRGAQLARRPPLGGATGTPRVSGRLLRVGVVTDVRLQGGRMPDLVLPPGPSGVGVDFGAIVHPRPGVG